MDPYLERRDSLRRHITRAREWSEAIRHGQVENAATIAARENLSRARVSQLMNLLTLAPVILEEICDPQNSGPVPTEYALRKLTQVRAEAIQLARYRRLVEESHQPAAERARAFGRSRVRRHGFQHLFEQARQLKAMCETGQFVSLRELGMAVGLCAERVGQVLNLLGLAPDLISKLDVPAEQQPGLSSLQLRELSRIRDFGAQRERFSAIVRGH